MQLLIDEIECNAIIGCHGYERNEKQPLLISLTIDLEQESYNDDILNTVHYSEICDFIKAKTDHSHFRLLESLSLFLCEQILEKYQIVSKVTVYVSKPNVNGKKARKISCKYTKARTYKIALALGSNMNSPTQQLTTAIELLAELVSDIKVASYYKSSPQGFSQQEDFYNTCISGYTYLTPVKLLTAIKKIEKLMGKTEKFLNGPRIIDIDIIFFDNQSYHKLFLRIPHEHMAKRDFVLQPLAEIEAGWQHPELGFSVKELLSRLPHEQQYIIKKVV